MTPLFTLTTPNGQTIEGYDAESFKKRLLEESGFFSLQVYSPMKIEFTFTQKRIISKAIQACKENNLIKLLDNN